MRLLSPTLPDVTDKSIIRFLNGNTNGVKFVSDYYPKRNSKIYYNTKTKSYIAKFTTDLMWSKGHRVVDKFFEYDDRFVAPFARFNVCVYKNGRTIVIDGNKYSIWSPQIFIGRTELSLQSITQPQKNKIVFNYGDINRELIITNKGFYENYIIKKRLNNFVRIKSNKEKDEVKSNPYFARDSQRHYLRLLWSNDEKYFPITSFDMAVPPIIIDDSFTGNLYGYEQNKDDCADLTHDINDYTSSEYLYVGTSGDSVQMHAHMVKIIFSDNIGSATINSATLELTGADGDQTVKIYGTYPSYTYIDEFFGGNSSYNTDVTNYVSGNNDIFVLDWETCNVDNCWELYTANLIIDYTPLMTGGMHSCNF